MSASVPQFNLQQLKDLYKQGMNHARNKFSSVFFSKDDKLCDYQLQLADKATDLTTLMNVISMNNNTWASSFGSPKAICTGCELQKTGIQFGVGDSEWYFLYGIAGNYSFNLSFFKQEIAPPEVVETVTDDRNEAVRWCILGGFGTINPKVWYSIPAEYIYLKYVQPTYSTFSLSGSGKFVSSALFQTTIPMQFQATLDFTDSENKSHNLTVFMTSNTPPVADMPNSCACSVGLGTLYYSYTDMNVSVTTEMGSGTGNGWIDHQLLKTGWAKGWYNQALQSVVSILSDSVSSGWLWFAVQDYESGLQYMLTHLFGKKFYQDDIHLNENIDMQLINVYKEGVTYFTPDEVSMASSDLKVQMIETILVNGINMPSKYSITLPGGKQVILALASAPNIFPVPHAPYECPAYLYDSTGTKIIGVGLIEANYYFTNKVFAQRIITASGGNPEDTSQVNIVLNGILPKQTFWKNSLSFLAVLIPLWIIIGIAIFVLYRKDKRRIRLMLSLVLVLIGVVLLREL